jgi:4-alpha-glucanotransferase
LQFAFDGHADNPFLPHNFVANTVVYTGTHDNPPTREWYDELPEYQRQNLWSYLNRPPGGSADAASALIGVSWSSRAALAIAPLQDVLNLGAESRMNVPGRATGNWRWRVRPEMLSGSAFEWLREVTTSSRRAELPVAQVESPRDNSVRATLSQV